MQRKLFDDESINIGQKLRSARQKKKLTQADLASETGLSKNHISVIERGGSQASIRTLLGYCRALDMTPNEILGFSDNAVEPKLQQALNSMDYSDQELLAEIINMIGSHKNRH